MKKILLVSWGIWGIGFMSIVDARVVGRDSLLGTIVVSKGKIVTQSLKNKNTTMNKSVSFQKENEGKVGITCLSSSVQKKGEGKVDVVCLPSFVQRKGEGKVDTVCLPAFIKLKKIGKAENNSKLEDYSVYDSWWSDEVDNDGDGYNQKARLNFDVDVGDGSTRSVYAKIYYKNLYSWYLKTTTYNFSITGDESDDAYWVDISDLPHDVYDFAIDIYKAGETSPLRASADNSTDDDLNDKYFELTSNDGTTETYSVYDSWWSDEVDNDGDGYNQKARLNFDVDVGDGSTRSVYAKIYYKTLSSWNLKITTSDFIITGMNSDDAYWVNISDLPQDVYDFAIDIYKAGETSPLRASADNNTDSDLSDKSFELASEDGVTEDYSIYDSWWSDEVDNDGDGYNQSARLNFDVDVGDGSTRSVYAKIYYKTLSSWNLKTTTSDFSITGMHSDDAYWVDISDLPHDVYDFAIDIYKAGETSPLRASADNNTDSDLSDKSFELASEDGVTETYSVYNSWWSDEVDNDGDGYNQKARLNFDVDVGDGSTRSVYAKIYYKNLSSWNLKTTTYNFSITGDESDDAYWVDISGLPHDTYDFKIDIYKGGEASPIRASADNSTDDDLNDKYFELASEDGAAETYSVYNSWWSDEVDDDGDGYWELARLNFDIDMGDSSTHSVYAKIYENGNWYCTTPDFTITSNASGDYQMVEIEGLSYGIYDFAIDIYKAGETSPIRASADDSTDDDLNDKYFETDVGIAEQVILPSVFELSQNSPNPVICETYIEYALPKATNISLAVYDMTGRIIRILSVGNQKPGIYKISWDGTDNNGQKVANGIYFYRMEAGAFKATKKLTVVK